MTDTQSFKVEKDGFITWLIMNRPEKRNTMTIGFFYELLDHFKKFDQDPEVRVVIIKAEGKSFTAGLDLVEASRELFQSSASDAREALRVKIRELQEGMNIIEKCRKPVIVAIHGHCIGGGIDLACACDLRLASQDAVFSIRETRIAIVADVGTLQRLPTIIGQGWTRELALTGRDFTAEEALKIGFITRICPDRDSLYAEAKKLAEEIAANSPLAVQGVKDVLNYSRDKGIYPGLEYVAQKNVALLPNEDMKEALQAFMEKRPPQFKGK